MQKIPFILIILLLSLRTFGQTALWKISSGYQTGDIYDNFKNVPTIYQSKLLFPVDSMGNRVDESTVVIQQLNYEQLTHKADSLFSIKHFGEAVRLYIIAFKNNADRGQIIHRYNSACCYSQLNEPDSAFVQLFRIAEKGNYYNYIEIQDEKYLKFLQKDIRWPALIKIVNANAQKIADKLDSQIP